MPIEIQYKSRSDNVDESGGASGLNLITPKVYQMPATNDFHAIVQQLHRNA